MSYEGALDAMVTVGGNGYEFKSWTRLFTFYLVLITLGKV